MEAGGQPASAQGSAAPPADRQAASAPAEQILNPAAVPGNPDRRSTPDALEHSGELAPVKEEEENDAEDAEDADGDDADAAAEADGTAADGEEEAAAGQALDGGDAPAAKTLSSKNSCRVEGCQRSLLKEKNYFRRYRCCKEHSRSPMVVIDGEQKRFCQQCCSFHPLEAFDGDRRNCRERLAMHNDRRRKRSQANTAASATANSRPVRVNAGAPPGSHRIIGGPDARALGADSPPAALPSIRTASGFGLARPPTGLLAGYGMNAFGGRGYVGGYGGGGIPAGPGIPAGYSAVDLETARRATEPPNSLTRAAAGFLSEASALLGRPSSRAAAMYGYSMRPVGGVQSPQQQLGQLQPSVGSLGMGFGGGGPLTGAGYMTGNGLVGGGGMPGPVSGIGSQPNPFDANRHTMAAAAGMLGGGAMLGANHWVGGSNGGGGGGNDFSPGVYDDGGDAGSIRTPSGRMLNKRRGSVNERMRSLDIHGHQGIDLDDRPDSIKRASFGLDTGPSVQRPSFGLDNGAGGMQRASFGLDPGAGGMQRAPFGLDGGAGGMQRASFGLDGGTGGMQRASFGADAGAANAASVYRASFGADAGFGGGMQRPDSGPGGVHRPSFGEAGIQRPSFGADAGFGAVHRPSFGQADGSIQRPSFGVPQQQFGGGGDPSAVHRPSFDAHSVHRTSFGIDTSVRQPSGGSGFAGTGFGAFADLSCMPNLAALRQAATAAEAGGSPGPGDSSLPGTSGGAAPGQELRSLSDGHSAELRAAGAAGSDAMSGMHGGFGGGLGGMGSNPGVGGGGSMLASLYPGGSVRSASGRLLPAGDGGAGVQVSGGFGGFGSAAVPGSDASGQMPLGGGGGAQGWGAGGDGQGGRSMARLSATQLDSLRRDAGLPSVKSLSSDQPGRQLAAQPNPFQGGRAAFAGLAAQAQRPQQAAWQQPAAAGWGVADMGAAGAPPRSNVPLAAAAVPATAAPLAPLQAPQQPPPQQAQGRTLLPDGTWSKEPGSPVLAGDPRLIDELMQEMMGGAAWPSGQEPPASAAGTAPRPASNPATAAR